MRFREQVRELREKRLLRTAGLLLLRGGCLRFRLDDVAEAAGVAKGTCYRHFPTTDALIKSALEHLDVPLLSRLSHPPLELESPRRRLAWMLDQAARAQLSALALRDVAHPVDPDELPGKVWPCCLQQHRCPYGGAAKTQDLIETSAANLRAPNPSPSLAVIVRILLNVVPTLNTGSSDLRLLRTEGLQQLFSYLIDRLFPEPSP